MLGASWEVGPQSPWLVHRQPISVRAPAPGGRVAVRRRDPALAANGGGFAREDGVCEGGQHVRTVQVPEPGGRGTGRGSQASGLTTRNPFPTPPPEKVAAQPRRVPQEHLQRFPEPSLPARPRRQRAGCGGGPLRGRGAGEKLRLRPARTPLSRPGPRSHRWGRSAPARWSPAPSSSRARRSQRSGAARRRRGAGAPPPCLPPDSLHRRGRLFAGLLRTAWGTQARAGAAQGHVRAGTFPDGTGNRGQSSRQDAAPRAPSPGRGGAGPAPALTPSGRPGNPPPRPRSAPGHPPILQKRD